MSNEHDGTMSPDTNLKPARVAPYLVVNGAAKAIQFYVAAFGAEETYRLPADDGQRLMHANLVINGGQVMLSDNFPEHGDDWAPQPGQQSPVSISLRLDAPEEVNEIYTRAVSLGATSVMAPDDMFWGDRFAMITDPFGHRWMLACALQDA